MILVTFATNLFVLWELSLMTAPVFSRFYSKDKNIGLLHKGEVPRILKRGKKNNEVSL